MKRVYLVRHGESVANEAEVLGSKEAELSDAGRLQAAQLAERVMNLDVEKLIASDFVRAQQTIMPTATAKKMDFEISSDFGEMFEPTSLHGLSDDSDELKNFRTERNAAIADPNYRFEDDENFFDLHERVNNARQYLEELEEKSVLVVAHAYYICYFTASILLNQREPSSELLALALRLNMDNTGISYLKHEEDKWRLMIHNDHAHFAE